MGWGISDVIKIRRDELPDLNQTPPIYWERTRGKTKQIAKTCLSETTVILLKEYLFNFPTDNPYLFHSNGSHISDVTVNQRLRDLARDAGIKIGNKKLHWHLFRKMIISQAKNLGIDPDTINVMVGKAVPKSLLTYMTDINVIEAFNKLQTVTRINGELIKPKTLDIESMGKTIVELTNKIKELESRKELVSLGETVSELTNKIKEQEARIKDQTDRIFELEQLVPPLEELMRFKWLLYGQKQRKQKQTKKPRPKDG